jgi:hypothetical protein
VPQYTFRTAPQSARPDAGRGLVSGKNDNAAVRDDGAHVREELDQRAGLGADELEIVEQDDARTAEHGAQVRRVLPLHAVDEGVQEVFRAHVEDAALAFRGAQCTLDTAQEVRLADAVRADDGDDVGRNAGAHGQTAGKAEGDAV